MFAFDSNHKPIVGQQVTLRRDSSAGGERLSLLRSQAEAGHCDLVAHSGEHGYLYDEGMFTRDDGRRVSVASLLHARSTVTYSAVPDGQGHRSGIDRDGDGSSTATSEVTAIAEAGANHQGGVRPADF